LIVRWGGEEFLIILYDRTPEYLKEFSKTVLEKIASTPLEVSINKTIFKTCSLGYAEMPLDPKSPEILSLEQMINISDYALYYAKENGRNCAAHFKLAKQIGTNEKLKNYLVNLSKSTKLNKAFCSIEFI